MIPASLTTKKIIRGDTFSELLVFNTIDASAVETPIDLTIYDDIVMDLRKGISRRAPLIESFSIGNNILITGDDNNELSILYPAETTDQMGAGNYYRDIRFVTGNEVKTYLYGIISVNENITEIE